MDFTVRILNIFLTKHFLLIAIVLITPIEAISKSGCCSWHGGINHCDNKTGKYVCNDSTYSPSCTCESKQATQNLQSSPEEHISEESYKSQIGNCPCPYNVDKAGNICGKRSSWCKDGAYSPACDLTKITQDIIEECNH